MIIKIKNSFYHFKNHMVKNQNKKKKEDKNLVNHILERILDYNKMKMILWQLNFMIMIKKKLLMEDLFQNKYLSLKIILNKY